MDPDALPLPRLRALVAEQPKAEFGWNTSFKESQLRAGEDGHCFAGKLFVPEDGGLKQVITYWSEHTRQPGLSWTNPALWQFARLAADLAEAVYGTEWRILPATSVWDTPVGSRGWPLHRDHPAFNFDPHGKPILLTFWAAVEGGGPGTGGVKGIPKSDRFDARKVAGTLHGVWRTRGPNRVYAWNHGVLHEGDVASQGPRKAFAVELVRADHAGPAAIPASRDASQVDLLGLALWSQVRYGHFNQASSLDRTRLEAHIRQAGHQWAPELGGAFDTTVPVSAALRGKAEQRVARLRQQMRGFSPVFY